MAYQTVKEGISAMLSQNGFFESSDPFTFKDESDQIDRKFRIERQAVDMDGDGTQYLINFVRPIFRYKIFLGFNLAANTSVRDYDVAQNVLDVLISYLNNPTNYSSYAVKMKTNQIKTALVDEHIESEVDLEVLDDITLT